MSSSRTKALMYNSLFAGVLQVFTMISGFIIPKLMLTYYGSEINGLVSSINQFIGYFRLVEAGLAPAAVYALYKPIADKNKDSIDSILSTVRNFYIKTGLLFVAGLVVFSVVSPFILKTSALPPLFIGLLVLVLGISGAVDFFTLSKYRVLLTADQKVYVISLASTAALIANILVIGILASLKVNVVCIYTAALFSVFVRSVTLSAYTKRKYHSINYKAPTDTKSLNKRWDSLYLQILGVIKSGTTVIVATFI